MKRFFTAVLFCLMIGSFIAACATTTSDKRGEGGKMSKPKPAREEVAPNDDASQPVPSPTAPSSTPSKSK